MMNDLGAAFVHAILIAAIVLLGLAPFAIAWRVRRARRQYERDPHDRV
jgi:hypothetical protein